MAVTTPKLTFAEYLAYDDGTGAKYELVNGDLVRMALGTGEHGDISEFLNEAFKAEIKRSSLPWASKDMKIGIQSPRGNRWDTCRVPDVVVLPLEQWAGLKKRESVIALHEPPPLLVVEVVSPSTATEDYRAKRSEYAVLNIPEYWIVDPIQLLVTVCTLREGAYDDQVFQESESIVSPTFPGFNLTAAQVLEADS
ncbi:Uma2 family endonuclease [Kovacikia minuta CCNUW1]|uniref:Uma2 family endonuclease n=1 Tax=Kovacikia minuta TaxID=2931930 RepID=UPI001CCE90E6|nr:Uma2 family endonuclease [Kovacikia minuta]UBF24108.1 Uma2 family endonuclease [Kovacikia minuta CCNUW1]